MLTRHRPSLAFGTALLAATVLGGCHGQPAMPNDADWPLYGLNSDEQRFAVLDQVTPDTVGRLGLAWSVDLPTEARSLEATPLEVGGVLYFTTAMAVVHAVDAQTGKELWTYDPEVWKSDPKALRGTPGQPNRGVAYWNGTVIDAATDGRLISLDAKTGKVNWSVDTIQEVDTRKQSTGAPRVFDGKVIIGNTGADWGTRGYVTAYDAKTGRQLWRFYTVPGDPSKGFESDAMRMAAQTWNGQWWKWGGGGTVWNAITYDADLHRIYIGVGNSANYNAAQRSPGGGDNLFLASIVALDADTGKYIWHYQVNPREAWDYKATADIMLADLTIDGKPRKVLMQAPTNGFFYVLDRTNGKLLSAGKMGKVTWASRIDLATGRPVEAPNIRYENGPVTFWPSPYGIHNWQAMSFSPQTGLVYVPGTKLGASYQASEDDKKNAANLGVGANRFQFPIGAHFGPPDHPDADDGTGSLIAWDPLKRQARWTVKLKTPWNGGTVATSGGLVFQGTQDGWFIAYDAATGRPLWRYQTGNGIISAPITYAIKGVQYVTILSGGNNPGGGKSFDSGFRVGRNPARVLTFRLDGKAVLPPGPGPDFSVKPAWDASMPIDETAAVRGEKLYPHTCLACHGVGAATAGMVAPNLLESPAAMSPDMLRSILQEGVMAQGGMPRFDDLPDADVRDLSMYLRRLSRDAKSGHTEKQTSMGN